MYFFRASFGGSSWSKLDCGNNVYDDNDDDTDDDDE
jgi:hypothetical protein